MSRLVNKKGGIVVALTIEIRNGFVYLVEAKVAKNSINIRRTHYYSFPEEWADESGILFPTEFAKLLSENLKDNGFKDKKVYICINNPSIIYRELIIPKLDEKRIPLIIRSEMMSALNLSPDYLMDYISLEEIERDGTYQIKVLAVAMQRRAIESILDVVKKCKLEALVIDSATNSVLKLIKSSKILDSQQVIIADVGNGHLRLYLFENGQYSLSRNNKLMSINEDSRDEIIENITENINKMIQFSYTRASGTEVKKIILTGLDELLPDIQIQVKENLLVECQIFEKPSIIEGFLQFENRYINAIGTLLRK